MTSILGSTKTEIAASTGLAVALGLITSGICLKLVKRIRWRTLIAFEAMGLVMGGGGAIVRCRQLLLKDMEDRQKQFRAPPEWECKPIGAVMEEAFVQFNTFVTSNDPLQLKWRVKIQTPEKTFQDTSVIRQPSEVRQVFQGLKDNLTNHYQGEFPQRRQGKFGVIFTMWTIGKDQVMRRKSIARNYAWEISGNYGAVRKSGTPTGVWEIDGSCEERHKEALDTQGGFSAEDCGFVISDRLGV